MLYDYYIMTNLHTYTKTLKVECEVCLKDVFQEVKELAPCKYLVCNVLFVQCCVSRAVCTLL